MNKTIDGFTSCGYGVVICEVVEVLAKYQKYVIKKILNKIGPRIDPCGTPERIIFRRLREPPFLTHCLRWLRYDSISFSTSLVTPYASSLAINKSCGKQSKALDKSIRMAPTRLFSSRHLRQVSINLSKTC